MLQCQYPGMLTGYLFKECKKLYGRGEIKFMNHRITRLFFQLLVCSQLLWVEQMNADNESNKAEFAEYVQEHTAYVKNLNETISRLKDYCIKTRTEYRYGDKYRVTYINPYASYQEIRTLYDSQQELKKISQTAEDQIDVLVQSGASINTADSSGKTPLQYADSYSMYTLLRSRGANFEALPFLSMHPWSVSITSAVLLAGMYSLYASGCCNKNRYAQYDPNVQFENPLYHRDVLGRTLLMNYLIAQEDKLVALRAQMQPLQYNSQEEHAYFSGLVAYQTLLEETQKTIQDMIEQGAELNIQDCDGKSLLNYCKTASIYKDLRSAGAPFELAAGAYFAQPAITGCCIVALPMMLGVLGVSHLESLKISEKTYFEKWYEKNYK